jgi:hypothetical protein
MPPLREATPPTMEMKEDLGAFKGIFYGIALSLPFWVIVLIVLYLFGVFG